jgi:rubrerythrin
VYGDDSLGFTDDDISRLWKCPSCGWKYPKSWKCPICGKCNDYCCKCPSFVTEEEICDDPTELA